MSENIYKPEVNDITSTDDSKRSALKKIVAGGAIAGTVVPVAWKSPVVDSVILPSHAATTTGGDVPGAGTTPVATPTRPSVIAPSFGPTGTAGPFEPPRKTAGLESPSILGRILDEIMPTASANDFPLVLELSYSGMICVEPNAAGTQADVMLLIIETCEWFEVEFKAGAGSTAEVPAVPLPGSVTYEYQKSGVPLNALTFMDGVQFGCNIASRGLLERTGLLQSAHAVLPGAAVSLASVINGATGFVTFNNGYKEFNLSVNIPNDTCLKFNHQCDKSCAL